MKKINVKALREATLGGEKYKGKENPNNEKKFNVIQKIMGKKKKAQDEKEGKYMNYDFEVKTAKTPHKELRAKQARKAATMRDIKEDAPTVNVGSGAIAGANGDPPVRSQPALIRRTKFAGHEVFEVNGDVYHKARLGKQKHHRYAKYVGEDEVGEEIRSYGRTNPGKPIVLKHEKTGALQFLKYGKY